MNSEQLGACALSLNFIARLFIEPPDTAFLSQVKENNVFGEWPLAPLSEETREALRFLKTGVETHDELAQAALMAEYTVLFIGPDGSIPLWESVWTTKDHLLFDGPMFDVREAYAQYGLVSPNPENEPDDHIGLEMSFLGGVMGCAAEAVDNGDMKAADRHLAMAGKFLNAHLARWSDRFLEAVAGHESSSFYRAVSTISTDTLAQAADLLQPEQA
ncbi:molecular chaperone TorD family protein [Pseudodesulfovibrio thermohalotolerans]|jgi:TorA maturation chaperone TorD|uniref:TorD/DmsD family molecular chaperone n=1 Tax=Pseudodesulfovibrio thermohalotolerans TaxID=2880651 RepID=UPI0024425279|nr:molecular chaperone TorD family protein [Pseudodesulfovibrio thermohalotolerans]WFS63364.1 molecular chaperone TorD family protein [Pseudodesulfovibrio thermohalotolerans]